MRFGQALDNALEKAVDQGKRKKPLSAAQRNHKINSTLELWLGLQLRRYRDPMMKFASE